MGFGMGLVSVSSLVLIQEIVDWSQRGSVTASNLFARNLGSTLGATILGAVLNYGLGRPKDVGPITSDRLRQVVAPAGAMGEHDRIQLALQQSLNLTFWAMLSISILVVVFAPAVPRPAASKATEDPAE